MKTNAGSTLVRTMWRALLYVVSVMFVLVVLAAALALCVGLLRIALSAWQ